MELLYHFPMLIKVAAIVTASAFFVIFFTLIVLYVNRMKVRKLQLATEAAEMTILDELNDHLLKYNAITDIPEDELNTTVVRLNALRHKSAVFSTSMVRLLVYFQLNLSGAIVRTISSAYSRLRLQELTLEKLRSKLWFMKTQGLTEAQEMKNNHSLPDIQSLTRDANQDVRVAAYTALLKLNAKEAFDFLEKERAHLSVWHQIQIIDAVTKNPDLGIPDFKRYLHTENTSILLLCIRLINHYGQFDAILKMSTLLNHEEEMVRNQVICALGELRAASVEQRLKLQYPKESNKNKAQILLALGRIGSGDSMEFLKDKFMQAEHFTLLKSAAAAIYLHPQHLKMQMIQKLVGLDTEQETVLKHYAEPLNTYGIH